MSYRVCIHSKAEIAITPLLPHDKLDMQRYFEIT